MTQFQIGYRGGKNHKPTKPRKGTETQSGTRKVIESNIDCFSPNISFGIWVQQAPGHDWIFGRRMPELRQG